MLMDALTPELYTEFLSCKDIPLLQQMRFEDLTGALHCALRERRIDNAKILKGERVALGYSPSGASAADMRMRLETLISQLDIRKTELNSAMAHNCSECCRQTQSIICSVLEAGITYVADK